MRSKTLTRAILLGIISVIVLIGTVATAEAGDGVDLGDRGLNVAQVQLALNDGGWPIVVDGVFGLRTYRSVVAFQKANGLLPDGIVGPATGAALGIGYAPAVRMEIPPAPVVAPPPVTYSGPCAQYVEALIFFSPGWNISTMQSIMNRESRCDPSVTSRTGCCHGLLQIHQMHVPYLGVCEVYSARDLFVPEKNICAAAVLYRRAGGMSPWRL